jgi:hypothetical protein
MIEGTGPGRGVPWWRWRRVLVLRFAEGIGRYPAIPSQREGRLVARIGHP